jgi:YD repeat-containing protein
MTLVMDAQAGFQISVDPAEYRCSPGTQPPYEQSQNLSYARTYWDSVGATWNYGYKTADGLYGGYAALGQVYKPGNSSPAIDLAFGKDNNVRRATDLANNSWDYFASPFRFQALTPIQAAAASPGSITYYDRYGQPVRQIDPLGRIGLTAYDELGRVSQRTNPEGDGETSHYDARGNVVKVDRNPKTGTGLAPLSRTFTYSEPTATVCAAPVTCNKPLTETDARNNTTNYAWDSFGNLTSVTRPADAAGNRPVTSFGYSTNLAGNDGAILRLPISETQLISPGVSTTTTYARDAANRYAISAATVDPTGLNLRTCIKFDPAGNLVSLSDPRQATCP